MQFVKVECWIRAKRSSAKAGAMMYIEDGIQMQTIFGDGSNQQKVSWARCSARASAC